MLRHLTTVLVGWAGGETHYRYNFVLPSMYNVVHDKLKQINVDRTRKATDPAGHKSLYGSKTMKQAAEAIGNQAPEIKTGE